ncbi:hypothetical protein [Shimia thalassica]|nr:hypothetical protein [Shimia thalassica]MDO6799360.1 hypothetical protein [Shimia thalassica]
MRALIPRDLRVIVRGFSDAQKSSEPGANAPSKSEHDELIRKYG